MRNYEIFSSQGPYCEYCGQSCKEYWPGRYDPESGSKVMSSACFNPGCWRGKRNLCIQSGGHHHKVFSTECRCGYPWTWGD